MSESKSEINLLFTSIYNKVSLIRGFRKAYQDLGQGGAIVAVDINQYSAGLYEADQRYLVSRVDNPNFLAEILTICEKENIRFIIPTRDEDLPFFAQHRETFEEEKVRLHAPSVESVRICQDKLEFFHFLTKHGIPTIQSWTRHEEVSAYPVIVKPITGKASHDVMKVTAAEELQQMNLDGKLIQEKITGIEYTVDYFADFDAQPICVVPRVRYQVEDGESKIGITRNEPEIIALAKRLGQTLGLIGHNTIQCFKTSTGETKFLEVNPRFGGGHPLGVAAGCKSPEFILRLLRGEKLEPVDSFVENLVMLRHSSDLFISYDQISHLRS